MGKYAKNQVGLEGLLRDSKIELRIYRPSRSRVKYYKPQRDANIKVKNLSKSPVVYRCVQFSKKTHKYN